MEIVKRKNNMSNINNETITEYKQKLDVFLEKVEELKSNIVDRDIIIKEEDKNSYHISNVLDAKLIDVLLKIINPTEHYHYFSINYFYEGLINTGPLDNQDSIIFMMWVFACLLEEQFFVSRTDKAEKWLTTILEGNYIVYLQNKRQKTEIAIQLDSYHKNFLRTKLPFLIQQEKYKKIEKQINNPEGEFNKLLGELSQKETEINNKLEDYTTRTEEIAKFIKELKEKLNFAGLGSAFNQLKEDKNSSKNAIRNWLIFFFLLLCGIPLYSIGNLNFIDNSSWLKIIPFITLEIIFLYIFRLLYQQYLFVKSELLQIDLRYNLCAFIEGYMEFKKEHKDETIELFEKLIFSNIISDEKKVPSTVDGLDTLAKLISEIKK